VGTTQIVEVLPFTELLVEESRVVNHDALELAIELLVVDAMAAFDFSIESGRRGFDVDVTDAFVEEVIVERPLKFGPVFRLNDLDLEEQTLHAEVATQAGAFAQTLGSRKPLPASIIFTNDHYTVETNMSDAARGIHFEWILRDRHPSLNAKFGRIFS
jgi:hypothetical protein